MLGSQLRAQARLLARSQPPELRRINTWQATDRLEPGRGHAGIHARAAPAAAAPHGATPQHPHAPAGDGEAPAVRYLTILTGASRGLGAAIALALAERGPPLPDAAENVGPSGAWLHDLVLLASDSGRLDSLVHGQLQQAVDSSTRAGSDSGRNRGPAAASVPPAAVHGGSDPSLPPSPAEQGGGVTRLHTMCFDLGDLDTLEENMSRLLSSAAAAAPSSDPHRSTGQAPSTSAPSAPSSSAGGGATGGVLPLDPAAYTHVLLVHNAGQVGDLLPVEDQSLANMRRQTDLNVTSFAALTAALLRTFLHTPVVTPELGCGTTSASASTLAAGRSEQQTQQLTQQQQQQQAGRRQISVVNISSVSVDQPYEHFSLYGMGKAARHMVIRCLAHEAALREEAHATRCAVSSSSGSGVSGQAGSSGGSSSSGATGHGAAAPPLARLRALSYAPGAIDTEMQASARKALPAGRLKAAFEENSRAGRLVDPAATSRVLYDIIQADTYDNGAHTDFYSATAAAAAAAAAEAALHPLAAARAAAAATGTAATSAVSGTGLPGPAGAAAASAVVAGRA